MSLNDDQQNALEWALNGYSMAILGPGGVGKSYTLKHIVDALRARGKSVALTASTGAATDVLRSSGIGDTIRTFHGFAGIGLGKFSAHSHAKFIRRKKDEAICAYDRLVDTDVLIIDEVSMIDDDFATKVSDVLQILRKVSLPFGGIQIILVGDFGQLPPVQKKLKEPFYIFEGKLWKDCVERTVVLSQVYRQDDKEFVEVLTKIRSSNIDDHVINTITGTRNNNLNNDNGIKPTTLYCYNANVDAMNAKELRTLPGKCHRFKCMDMYASEEDEMENKKSFSFAEDLFVKVGAQVMCVANVSIEGGIVNGSRGIVTHVHNLKAPQDTWVDGDDELTPDYVRVKYMNGQEVRMERFKQEVKGEDSRSLASRTQFPLKLSWAITIHKSQGATIDLLDIDLNGCFSPGQAYVAISRGTSLKTMRVRNFKKESVIASIKVCRFYEQTEFAYKKLKQGQEQQQQQPPSKKSKYV